MSTPYPACPQKVVRRQAGPFAGRSDDAGNRCRMVRVAVGRSGDGVVGKVEASERVRRRHIEAVVQNKIRV